MTVAILTAFAALVVGAMQSLTTAVTASLGLTAFQAIIVPGTGTPDPYAADEQNYLNNVMNYYVNPGGDCGAQPGPATDCPPFTGVRYYATFWPIPLPGWGGLEGQKWNVSVADGLQNLTTIYNGLPDTTTDVTIFGYSQGATVASNFKRLHPQDSTDLPLGEPLNDYFFIGNPQRPTGGFFERLAFLGNVPILDAQFGNPSPTDSCDDGDRICTTDFALQYDGVADFPQWLANPVAVGNAIAGFQYIHGTYLAPSSDDPPTETPYGYTPEEIQVAVAAAEANCNETTYCQRVPGSDTRYITLPARYLPIFQPFVDLGDATGTSVIIIPITDFLSPFTQTLIETGYDRTNYANPQPGTILPPKTFNPIQTAVDLVSDVPEGINMALTPGRTPLPGSPLVQTTTPLSDANTTNVAVAKTEATETDLRLGIFAEPGESTSSSDANTNRPLRNALKDFHPVRDVAKAVSGTVNKALGKDGSAAGSGDDSAG
ncbi:PE-PPE domain-containing protein [Mycobacterium sp. ITM-2016-00318]|uniref:PE-PPE domain-containing protein n=1 Tax=Mycobacterium sp. ITM-2016-00318 TaxID=2099693 RepID=UPI001E46A55C|nr:PE-PPE domain-containing protein [Mycobacterium sp. ITM-2016-00318]WNG93959.1 PE-PPE domain-containing protein [Mycobacterium sp. ITM-2016-00318]